jgi:dipeptidase E
MRLLLISSSNVYGSGYLDHAERDLRARLDGRARVAFVPFALQDHETYTATARERLGRMGCTVAQVHGAEELEAAEAIFVGGGNTFRLLKTLYERDLLDVIRTRVRAGVPYIGTSAGTNIAAPTIRTTNDMPIVEPPSFDALGLVPYQINPHYFDADPTSTHQGETREQRIAQYLEENTAPVIGLREGTMLWVDDAVTTLHGDTSARIFKRGAEPVDVEAGSVIEL